MSQQTSRKLQEEKEKMREHYTKLKYKPPKGSVSTMEAGVRDSASNPPLTGRLTSHDDRSDNILHNKVFDEMKHMEYAKEKHAKMQSYRKQIRELYMPKVSE